MSPQQKKNPGPQKKIKKCAKNRQTKLFISFDENARREYLTGFRKRKLDRKRKAKQKLEEKLKDERREIRKEKREIYRTMMQNYKEAPEIKHLVDPKVFDLEQHTVTVTDVSEIDITGQDGLRLGVNKGSIVNKLDEKKIEDSEEENEENAKKRKFHEEKLRHRINKANDLQQRIKAKQKKKHKPRDPNDPKSGSRRNKKQFGKKKKNRSQGAD